jgi:hypothetical protein
MMNIRLIVYRIAQIIQMTDKISKNVMIEKIVWELTPFLMMRIDDCRGFLINEIDHCRSFLMSDCENYVIFLKFSVEVKNFLERMTKKIVVWENFSLLMIREVNVSLMIAEVIFLIDLEMMILEILISFEIEMSIEI